MTARARLALALFAVGFTAMVGQLLMMRELVATFYGNELLFGLILAAWLAWGAAGAALAARPHTPPPAQGGGSGVALGLALAAMLLPAQLALVRGARALLGATPGTLVEFGPMVGAIVVIVAPLCLLLGALFSIATRLTVERGGTPGQAYVWESAGAVLGGALFSFALIRWLNPFQTAFLVGAADLTVALLLLRPSLFAQRVRPLAPVILAALIGIALPIGRAAQTATLRWQWPDLVFAGDSPYGRLTIQARSGQRIFYTDGLLAFETQGTFPEEVAHFPLLAHPDPREVLLIGGGVAGDLREILKHPIESVTYVELDPLLIEAAQAHLPAEDAAVLNDPRVRLVFTDGRSYVKTGRSGFDVIILDLPEPATGALNRFYTAEFFAEARARLRPGGILALGLPSAENYWSPELARRNASIYDTLRSVFPQVTVLPGEHDFFLASGWPIEIDPGVLAGRLAERGVQTRWVTPSYIEYVLAGDRFRTVQQKLAGVRGTRQNRDLQPISYYYDLALWLSRFYPGLRTAFESASLASIWWVAVPLALVTGLARWRRRWAVPLVIAGTGLAQMLLELVILFAFQVQHGYLYAEVSLIVTAFMGGLALGGEASNRLLAGPYARRETQNVKRRTQDVRRALSVLLAGIAIYSSILPLVFSISLPAPQLAFPVLALLGGCLGGMVFPLAAALPIVSPNSTVGGRLYAADLAGGCLGALLGAAFLVPILGIPQTCAAVALVGLAGLIAVS